MNYEISVFVTKEELLNYFITLNSFAEKENYCNQYIHECQILIKTIKDNKRNYYKENGKIYLKYDLANKISWLNQNVKLLNTEFSKERRINERLQKAKIRESVKEQCYTVCPLTQSQAELLNKIESFNKLSNISTNDLVTVYKYAIKNIDSFSYEFFNSIHSLLRIKITKGDIKVHLSSLKNWIKHEQLSLSKEDSKNKLFNDLKKEITSLLDLYSPAENNHDYRSDIVDIMIEDENYYDYLKLMIVKIPEIVNIKNEQGESILVDIIRKYIKNYERKLQNQKKNYIDPKYLEQIIILFRTSKDLNLSSSDNLEIKNILDTFEKMVLKKKYKKEPVEQVMSSIDAVRNGAKESITSVKRDFDMDDIIKYNTFYSGHREDINEKVLVLNNNNMFNNYAYSASLNGHNVSLKIHVVDISSYVELDSSLYDELKSRHMEGIELFDIDTIKNYFSLIPGKERLTLTYEMVINCKGRIEAFNIYPSKVIVDKVIDYSNIKEESKSDTDIQNLLYAFYRLTRKKKINKELIDFEIEDAFKKTLNLMVGKNVSKNKLPFIYKVQKPLDKEKIYRLQTNLAFHFSKIDDDSFNAMSQILSSPMNSAYYSKQNFGHVGLNYRYYMDLLNPINSFAGIMLQYCLKDYYVKNKMDSETITFWDRQIDSLLNNKKLAKKI